MPEILNDDWFWELGLVDVLITILAAIVLTFAILVITTILITKHYHQAFSVVCLLCQIYRKGHRLNAMSWISSIWPR